MKSTLRWVVAAVVVLHGLIHFLGAAKGFGWADVTQLKEPIGPPLGAAWLAAGALTVIAGFLIGARTRGWWMVGGVAVVASQAVIFTSWNDARVGTLANLVLLAAVAYGYVAQRPASHRANYREQLKTVVNGPPPAGVTTESDLSGISRANAPAPLERRNQFPTVRLPATEPMSPFQDATAVSNRQASMTHRRSQ